MVGAIKGCTGINYNNLTTTTITTSIITSIIAMNLQSTTTTITTSIIVL